MKKTAPIFLDLKHFKWPWSAIVSGLHRASGLLLFALMPALVLLLNHSTQSEAGFYAVKALLHSPISGIILCLVLWGLLHHLLSGIRFLLIDADIGVAKLQAQYSAKIVSITAAVLAVLWTVGLLA